MAQCYADYLDELRYKQDDFDAAFETLTESHLASIRSEIAEEVAAVNAKYHPLIDGLTEEFAAVAKPALMVPVWAAYLKGDKAAAGLLLVALMEKAMESIAEENAQHSMSNRI